MPKYAVRMMTARIDCPVSYLRQSDCAFGLRVSSVLTVIIMCFASMKELWLATRSPVRPSSAPARLQIEKAAIHRHLNHFQMK